LFFGLIFRSLFLFSASFRHKARNGVNRAKPLTLKVPKPKEQLNRFLTELQRVFWSFAHSTIKHGAEELEAALKLGAGVTGFLHHFFNRHCFSRFSAAAENRR